MGRTSTTGGDRPNILVIMSDEHDPGVMGCYGDPVVQTPNLDRLAADGVTFDAAYTTSPLCVPARLSFTAGKYISRCGAWSNDCWLPSDDYPSLPRVLNAAGYESYLCGKMHYDATRRYGFADLFDAWTNHSRKTGKGGRRDPRDTTPHVRSWTDRARHFHAGETSRVLQHDEEVTRRSVEFLRQRSRGDQPFFLLAGYLGPHFPLIVPEAYWQRYRGRVPEPTVPEGLIESLPTNYQHLRYGFGLTATEPELVTRGRELYWGFVDWLDGEIGKLLAGLGDSAVAEHTVVVYTSDHGENKGDHGLWWKNNMFEHASRAPLIVSWPARWAGGQRRSGACSFVDLVQTVAALGGATCPDDWDGDSLLGVLDGDDSGWKDFAVSEYYGHNIASGFAMYRQGPWKYVYHTRIDEEFGPERELYHLGDDPQEFRNLAGESAHADRIAAMHKALVAEVGRDPDDAEADCRADYARGYVRT